MEDINFMQYLNNSGLNFHNDITNSYRGRGIGGSSGPLSVDLFEWCKHSRGHDSLKNSAHRFQNKLCERKHRSQSCTPPIEQLT